MGVSLKTENEERSGNHRLFAPRTGEETEGRNRRKVVVEA